MASLQARGPAAGLALVRLDRLSRRDASTLELLLQLVGRPEGRTLLVLPEGRDRHETGQHGDQALDTWTGELVAGLAESLVEQARYDEADALLDRLRRGALGPAARAVLTHVAGRAAAQRLGDHRGLLDEAWSLAEYCGDDQRMVQVACARRGGLDRRADPGSESGGPSRVAAGERAV